jgi:carboxyl-terminal processing protease
LQVSVMGKHLSLYKLIGLILMVEVLAVPGALAKPAEPLPSLIPQLVPSLKYTDLDQTIIELLAHYHYRHPRLDTELSAAIFDAYLEALDFNRSYFLANDIANFEKKYRLRLNKYLVDGNLQPAFEIFNLYQQRLAQRTDRILEQLQQDFDFNTNESMELDRHKAPWSISQKGLDEIWRKRLKNELLTLKLAGKDLAAARDTLKSRYEGLLRRTAQSTGDDVFQLYMNAVSQCFDPHTAYFSPRVSENFNIQMRLSLEGIGTVLRMEEERITVVELVAGGPADLSKQLKPGDKIVGVGQEDGKPMVDVIGWRLDDVVDLIRGPRGSVVRLQIVPAEAQGDSMIKAVRLVRDTIKLEKQAAKSEVKTLPSEGRDVRIGIITIPAFYSDFAAAQRGETDYRGTTNDVRRLLKDLQSQKVDGIIIDLRQNGGGSLQEAVELTGLFIKDGPVVQVRRSNGAVEVENDPDPSALYEGPLALLVDRFSASAAEIFAGAIQDYGRGIVIGSRTFGKGTVQTLIDLTRFVPKARDPVGQLKLTIAKFYRINGSSTQNRGVIPDIALPSAYAEDEVGEGNQKHALAWDEIRATRYQSNPQLANLVPELLRRYQARVAKDPAFSELLEDLKVAERARKNTTVSLSESQRKLEWDKLQARMRERENQHRLSLGLKPLQKNELIPEQDNREDPADLLMEESTRIVADMISLLHQQGNTGAIVMSTN